MVAIFKEKSQRKTFRRFGVILQKPRGGGGEDTPSILIGLKVPIWKNGERFTLMNPILMEVGPGFDNS